MGYTRSGPDEWNKVSATYAATPTDKIFKTRSVHELPDELNPKHFKIRESRDSNANPQSTAIIIATDVTGSMGILADNLIKKGLGLTYNEIDRRAKDPNERMLTDPHLLVMGIGDVLFDQAPVQATQFESDTRVAEQLEKIFIERGGGGNSSESYDGAWYFGARRTSIDCYEKRGKKGYLFTVGDEEAPYGLSRHAIKEFFGDDVETDLTPQQLLAMAEEKYHVFHIMIAEGSHARSYKDRVRKTWTDMLGQRALWLADHTKLAELIVSTIQVNEGDDINKVASTWSGDTSLVVASALKDLVPGGTSDGGDLVKL